MSKLDKVALGPDDFSKLIDPKQGFRSVGIVSLEDLSVKQLWKLTEVWNLHTKIKGYKTLKKDELISELRKRGVGEGIDFDAKSVKELIDLVQAHNKATVIPNYKKLSKQELVAELLRVMPWLKFAPDVAAGPPSPTEADSGVGSSIKTEAQGSVFTLDPEAEDLPSEVGTGTYMTRGQGYDEDIEGLEEPVEYISPNNVKYTINPDGMLETDKTNFAGDLIITDPGFFDLFDERRDEDPRINLRDLFNTVKKYNIEGEDYEGQNPLVNILFGSGSYVNPNAMSGYGDSGDLMGEEWYDETKRFIDISPIMDELRKTMPEIPEAKYALNLSNGQVSIPSSHYSNGLEPFDEIDRSNTGELPIDAIIALRNRYRTNRIYSAPTEAELGELTLVRRRAAEKVLFEDKVLPPRFMELIDFTMYYPISQLVIEKGLNLAIDPVKATFIDLGSGSYNERPFAENELLRFIGDTFRVLPKLLNVYNDSWLAVKERGKAKYGKTAIMEYGSRFETIHDFDLVPPEKGVRYHKVLKYTYEKDERGRKRKVPVMKTVEVEYKKKIGEEDVPVNLQPPNVFVSSEVIKGEGLLADEDRRLFMAPSYESELGPTYELYGSRLEGKMTGRDTVYLDDGTDRSSLELQQIKSVAWGDNRRLSMEWASEYLGTAKVFTPDDFKKLVKSIVLNTDLFLPGDEPNIY